jgi:hypothetical protein
MQKRIRSEVLNLIALNATQPLRMHQIKRIIKLQNEGRSIRETERLTGLSRNTIREYMRRISVSGLAFSQLLLLDDESLNAIIYVDDMIGRYDFWY